MPTKQGLAIAVFTSVAAGALVSNIDRLIDRLGLFKSQSEPVYVAEDNTWKKSPAVLAQVQFEQDVSTFAKDVLDRLPPRNTSIETLDTRQKLAATCEKTGRSKLEFYGSQYAFYELSRGDTAACMDIAERTAIKHKIKYSTTFAEAAHNYTATGGIPRPESGFMPPRLTPQ